VILEPFSSFIVKERILSRSILVRWVKSLRILSSASSELVLHLMR